MYRALVDSQSNHMSDELIDASVDNEALVEKITRTIHSQESAQRAGEEMFGR